MNKHISNLGVILTLLSKWKYFIKAFKLVGVVSLSILLIDLTILHLILPTVVLYFSAITEKTAPSKFSQR